MSRNLVYQMLLAFVFVAAGFGAGAAWKGRSSAQPEQPSIATPTPSRTPAPTHTPTNTPTATASATPTVTLTPTATRPTVDPPTPGPSPTLDFPDGIVLEQSNCRYGPGAGYLYEWGLYTGDRVSIEGRNDLGTWVYVKPRSYQDRCWVKASLLQVTGDIFSVPPTYNRLPFSELYLPPTNPRATRFGNEVRIAWDPVWMTEDDYRGYLIEAWLCRDGQIIFTPIGIDGTSVVVRDEPGCSQPSSARLYTAEKHGYTQWVMVPWPAHTTPEASPTP